MSLETTQHHHLTCLSEQQPQSILQLARMQPAALRAPLHLRARDGIFHSALSPDNIMLLAEAPHPLGTNVRQAGRWLLQLLCSVSNLSFQDLACVGASRMVGATSYSQACIIPHAGHVFAHAHPIGFPSGHGLGKPQAIRYTFWPVFLRIDRRPQLHPFQYRRRVIYIVSHIMPTCIFNCTHTATGKTSHAYLHHGNQLPQIYVT